MATLYVVATPIGNLDDITLRALRILGEVQVLACEDTRVTRRIFERHGLDSPRTFFSCHEHNETHAANRIVGFLNDGIDVALCSDAGSPSVSDPGYRVILAAVEADHDVDVIPGASAVHTALLASALPPSSYTFKGFPPVKGGPRRRFLEEERDRAHTLVLFESPHRLAKMLQDAFDVFGNRQAAVCLELTKKFQRIHRAPLYELAATFSDKKIKGEITVVIAGNNPKFLHPSPDASPLSPSS